MGKWSSPPFLGVYVTFVALWLPFWLLSFVITEWGIYLLAVFTVFFIGRSIILLIAFPGASQKVTATIETEFAKYSVRIIMFFMRCNSGSSILSSAFPGNKSGDSTIRQCEAGRQTCTISRFSGDVPRRTRFEAVYLDT